MGTSRKEFHQRSSIISIHVPECSLSMVPRYYLPPIMQTNPHAPKDSLHPFSRMCPLLGSKIFPTHVLTCSPSMVPKIFSTHVSSMFSIHESKICSNNVPKCYPSILQDILHPSSRVFPIHDSKILSTLVPACSPSVIPKFLLSTLIR